MGVLTGPQAGVYFYHADGLGSVAALSQLNAGTVQVVERYDDDAFGRTTVTLDGSTSNPYRYTARRYDDESGLYYYRARMYSPELGRFLQADPIGYADGMNMYAYCGNDPINFVDPWGLRRRARKGRSSGEVDIPSLPGSGTANDPYIITDDDLKKEMKHWYQTKGKGMYNPRRLKGSDGDTSFYGYSSSYFRYNGETYGGDEVNYIGVGMGARRFHAPWWYAKGAPDRWNKKKYKHAAKDGEKKIFKMGYDSYSEAKECP